MSSACEQEKNTRTDRKYSTPQSLKYKEDTEGRRKQENGSLAKYWLILAVTFLITFFFASFASETGWARWDWRTLFFWLLLIGDLSGLSLLLFF